MIIENVEALKTWLIATLKPICDADPASLAKYVVALVKKDKTEKDLRDVCMDQLDVFLQTKTKGFVDSLFECLKNKTYLTAVNNETVKPVQLESKASESVEPAKTEAVIKKEENGSDSKKQKVPAEKPKEIKRDEKERRRPSSRSLSPRDRRRDYDDRRKRFEDRRISDDRRPYRRRSRSRSYSPRRRQRRSRSPRGRSRSWSRSRSRSRPRSWTRSRSRSWSRSRSRSRDRKGKRPLPDSRGSTPTLDNGKYSISTIGPIPTVGTGAYSTAPSDSRFTLETTSQGQPPPSARQRCKDYDEKGFCLRGDLCQFDHGLDPVVVEDVSIPPPYIPGGPPPPNGAPRIPGPGPGPGPGSGPGPGPGFIPRHGPPPHQMIPRHPPPRNEHFEPYNPEAPAISRPPPPPFWHGPPPPNGPPPRHGGPPNQQPFLPQQQQQQLPVQVRQRDHLVTVQVKQEESSIVPPGTEPSVPLDEEDESPKKSESVAVEGKSERMVIAPKRSYDNNSYHRNNNSGPPPAKKPFDYNRIGGYRKPNVDKTVTQLEVRKIPKQFNNIMSINEHFSKFGMLTNIQVNFEGDQEAALVSFATNDQALACYRSSEPLFNNRFVKVFWHKDKENDQGTSGKPPDDHRSVKARLGPPVIPHPSKMTFNINNVEKKPQESPTQEIKEKSVLYTSSVGSITKTVYNPEAIKARTAIKSPTAVSSAGFVSKIEAIKRKEEQKKDALKKKQEIEKQKQQLLQKQLNQQKMLIEKLEKNKNMSAEEKVKIKETLNLLSTSIEKVNTGMAPKKAIAQKVTNPDQARKEILDTELELFNKQHTGEDTTELKMKLSELTKQAAAMGLLGRGRGRGKVVKGAATKWVAQGFVGRGRGFTTNYHQQPGGSRVLDNRPKQLEVSGFSVEEKDLLLAHFSLFGQVEKVEHIDEDSGAIITFKTRKDAEKAMSRAAKFHDKNLIMKWHIEVKVKINLNLSSDDSFTADAEEVGDSEVVGGEDDLDEEALLAGDDEEEEDEESRSWRR